MENFTSATIRRSAYLILICTLISFTVSAQQYIIADKDNTHPEIKTQDAQPAMIARLSAERASGYNEIQWTGLREYDTRKYIIEYSTNGIDFKAAGEVNAGRANYTYKHHLIDNSPAIYRIKTEQMNNRSFYSQGVLLLGARQSPVKIFPTVVQGNMINIDSYWPIERINIFSSDGAQVYAKDLNGKRDYMTITLPSLGKGIYFMAFRGRGWKTTEKFMVQ